MTLHDTYKKLENDCFNGPRPAPLLIVDPNPPHDLKYFSLILRLENTLAALEANNAVTNLKKLPARQRRVKGGSNSEARQVAKLSALRVRSTEPGHTAIGEDV